MSKPERSIKVGNIQAAVWSNTFKDTTIKSVTFSKSYKDKDGKWQQTSSFGIKDLPFLARAAQLVWDEQYVKDDVDDI